ncbi:FKBP-type peptidyl-prolyl cis-trans isomerase [Pseudoalteromonas luteoviolacea]|uniref:Peptidyl-prolyl cis-trans isomerase n=1 Tax=Pseudoalteromonas luteoviolacea H33 TaxID=1365251 RepID=A0A167FM72_9GAMM|nr:peptidylprolyl isomerase [Pseudoalteromonas luteoviolacea]KZN52508.1 peptidyl-prolyl cis-trans isomerase [Pseudoalteromonas luteoviolacea H33]KZN76560.1 peptidyl-prolyl cis-trans isomerase [Pseudoalteromonas luteoviolacea H33-S]MBQ4877055.1 peptidylprolyl isomerase [Pseudoalteromonas luteoviolacea]MBQ4905916.1 peptidylprolyl isomerase [Pseudoalteromonas luteoviolacea]
MKIAQNAVVKMHYAVLDDDQNTIDNTFDEEPLEFIIGTGFLIEGLENALIDKQAGDKISVTVKPEEGYGERNDNLTQAVPKSMFEGIDVEVGMQFRATTDEGEQAVIVIGVEDDEVIVDGNHPLSGLTLHFDVEILDVREATADELAHGHVHGAGGCGHDH